MDGANMMHASNEHDASTNVELKLAELSQIVTQQAARIASLEAGRENQSIGNGGRTSDDSGAIRTHDSARLISRGNLLKAAAAGAAGLAGADLTGSLVPEGAMATSTNTDFLATGGTYDAFSNSAGYIFGANLLGSTNGLNAISTGNSGDIAVQANARAESPPPPVSGSLENIAVLGVANNTGCGVYGQTSDSRTTASPQNVGVYGMANAGYGVIGDARDGAGNLSSGTGVLGHSGTGSGVNGQSYSGAGMLGSSDIGVGVVGQAGTTGIAVVGQANGVLPPPPVSGTLQNIGVVGVSTACGVYGQTADSKTTASPGNVGVYGMTNTGFGVIGDSRDGSGNLSNGTGVLGHSGSGVGVLGQSTGAGVMGQSFGGGADLSANGSGHLYLQPQSTAGAPTAGIYPQGEIVVDSTGTVFVCTAGGTPGTWSRLTTTAFGLQPFAAGVRVFHQAMTPGLVVDPVDATKSGTSGVPAGARAAYCAVQSSGVGSLTLFPHGVSPPLAANWTNNGTAGVLFLSYMLVPLDSTGKFGLKSNNITGNCYVDAWGYLL